MASCIYNRGFAAMLSYFFRRKAHESTIFIESIKKHHIKVPLFEVFKNHKISFLRATSIMSIMAIVTGSFSLYLPTFFKLSNIDGGNIFLISLMLFALLCIFFGALADRLSIQKIFYTGVIGITIFGSAFYLSVIHNSQLIDILLIISSIFLAMVISTGANYASSIFSPIIRASGLGLSYNIAYAIFNGIFFALATYGISEGIKLMPLYITLIVIIISTTLLFISKNHSLNNI